MRKFPLCDELKLHVFRPDEANGDSGNVIYAGDLERLLEAAQVVYGRISYDNWSSPQLDGDTHTALVLNIQQIKKPCVEHDIEHRGEYKIQGDPHLYNECLRCGVKLKSVWEEVK